MASQIGGFPATQTVVQTVVHSTDRYVDLAERAASSLETEDPKARVDCSLTAFSCIYTLADLLLLVKAFAAGLRSLLHGERRGFCNCALWLRRTVSVHVLKTLRFTVAAFQKLHPKQTEHGRLAFTL